MFFSTARRYLQEITFGFEDSLVSTVGAVTGVAAGAGDRGIVLLAGLVIVMVEVVSMAAGSYLSDKAKHDAKRAEGKDASDGGHRPLLAGVVMGFSYLLAGMVPLAPYLFLPISLAPTFSIVLTLVALFAVGVWQTTFTRRAWWRSGSEMFLVGGAAIVLGFLVGRLASGFLT